MTFIAEMTGRLHCWLITCEITHRDGRVPRYSEQVTLITRISASTVNVFESSHDLIEESDGFSCWIWTVCV